MIEVGRRERKRQELHQSLLDVAEVLFEEQGVARTTVDDIAEHADVARQTVFNHFPYKEALAIELSAEGIDQIAQCAHALLEAGTPAPEVLQYTAERVLDLALRLGEVAVVVARELLHSDAERAARAAQLVPLRQIIEALLSQAREEGSVRQDLPLDVVASRFCALLTSVVAQAMTCSPEALRRELSVSIDMLFNGIKDRRN